MQIILKRTTANDPLLRALVLLLDKELRSSNGDEAQDALDQYNIIQDNFHVVLAYAGDIAVGCSCFKEFDADTVEVKRMFVLADHRRRGIAAAMLTELELWAHELGYKNAVLETGTRLHEAVKLYNKTGYAVRAQYGQYVDVENSICMEKPLSIIINVTS